MTEASPRSYPQVRCWSGPIPLPGTCARTSASRSHPLSVSRRGPGGSSRTSRTRGGTGPSSCMLDGTGPSSCLLDGTLRTSPQPHSNHAGASSGCCHAPAPSSPVRPAMLCAASRLARRPAVCAHAGMEIDMLAGHARSSFTSARRARRRRPRATARAARRRRSPHPPGRRRRAAGARAAPSSARRG